MKKTWMLVLAVCLALGVGFAQESGGETGGAETGGAMMGTETGGSDTGGAMMGETGGAMMGAPTIEGTVELFDGGITEVPLDVALANIQGWEDTLRAAGDPDLDTIADNLADLATALQAEPVDGAAVADLLSMLGDETRAAAESASVDADTANQLTLFASLLTQVGQQLSGESGGSMMGGETGGSTMGGETGGSDMGGETGGSESGGG